MNFSIIGIMENGCRVFDGTACFIPRIGEEIEVNGNVFVVQKVRYLFRQGANNHQAVQFTLKMVHPASTSC